MILEIGINVDPNKTDALNLHKLLINFKRFLWSSECQNEFDNLKELLTENVILKFYDISKPVELHTEAQTIGVLLI